MIKLSNLISAVNKGNLAKEANRSVSEAVAQKTRLLYPKTVPNANGGLTRFLGNGNQIEIFNKDGVTIRNVYDPNGNRILEDTKKFLTEKVGDKVVKTKEVNRKISVHGRLDTQTSYKAERDYKDNKLLGMRETEIAPYILNKGGEVTPTRNYLTYVTKSYYDPNRKAFNFKKQEYIDTPAANGYVKIFKGDGQAKRVVDKKLIPKTFYSTDREHGLGGYKPEFNMGLNSNTIMPGSQVDPTATNCFIRYNKKGLPMPSYVGYDGIYSKYTKQELDNMSLKEMREAAAIYQPLYKKEGEYSVKYSPSTGDFLNLRFLDIPYKK